MKYACYLSVFVLLVSIGACKKETTNPNRYIDNDLRGYFFNTGTYWVYENNITHELDSQYVTSSTHFWSKSVGFRGSSDTFYQENFNSTINDAYNDSVYNGGWGVQGTGFGISSVNYINSTNYGVGFGHNAQNRIGIFDSVTISDSVIYQVYQYNILAASMLPVVLSYDNEFWIAPHYGIIKRIEYGTPLGTVEWNLVRWNIVF